MRHVDHRRVVLARVPLLLAMAISAYLIGIALDSVLVTALIAGIGCALCELYLSGKYGFPHTGNFSLGPLDHYAALFFGGCIMMVFSYLIFQVLQTVLANNLLKYGAAVISGYFGAAGLLLIVPESWTARKETHERTR